MQKVGLPPITSGIQISTIASREPPSRSWSRYKKLLIDNPKDANLLQRQKLWNFQKLNRGAFRSQITSLPDIPYRVKQNTLEKSSVGVQVNLSGRYGTRLRLHFPNLTGSKREPTYVDDNSDSEYGDRTDEDEYEYEEDFEECSSIEDPGLEFESVVRKKNVGTMTIPRRDRPARRKDRRKRARDRDAVKKEKKSILLDSSDVSRAASPKAVSFAQDTAREWDDDVQLPNDEHDDLPTLPCETSTSSNDSFVKLPLENIGHSSQQLCDPQSVLDFLSGNRTDRSSKMTDFSMGKTPRDKTKRRNKPTDPEADRVWFEKIVGDKEIVDVATYESFARTRPNTENQSDSANERIVDFSKVYVRKNFTPRVNDEFPQYHSVVAKEGQNTQPKKQPPPTINKGRGQRRGLIGIGKSY